MALRLCRGRRLSSAATASLHKIDLVPDPVRADPLPFAAQALVKPDLDPASIRLPRRFVQSALTRGYLEQLRAYLKDIGLGQCNPELIAHALIHPSVVNEWNTCAMLPLSWKGLAFVGDALIYFLSASYLIQSVDNMSPNSMHYRRFAMLNNDTLSRAFTSPTLSLSKHLVLPRKMPPRSLPGVMATSMEAFIGAVYLDKGLASPFFAERLLPELWRHRTQESSLDPISRLQEQCQRKYHTVPEYKTLRETKVGFGLIEFEVGLYMNGDCLQRASANSLSEARKLAALLTLERHHFANM